MGSGSEAVYEYACPVTYTLRMSHLLYVHTLECHILRMSHLSFASYVSLLRLASAKERYKTQKRDIRRKREM